MNTQHKPCSFHIQAKAKNFKFKLKANTFIPDCYNFFQFSVFLKIYSLVIRVGSDNNINNNQPSRRKSLKSRITGFIKRFRSIPTKRKASDAQNSSRIKKLRWVSCEGPICASTQVIGNLVLLIQSIYEKDLKGMIVHCFSLLLYILTLLKTFIRIKNNKLLLVSILLMVGYPLWLSMFNNKTNGRRTFAGRFIWKTFHWAASHGFLNAVAHVI